jgi:hypothetical protein
VNKHVGAFCIECSRAVGRICSFDNHADHQINDLCCDSGKDTGVLGTAFRDKTNSVVEFLAKLTSVQRDFNKDMDRTRDELDKYHDDVFNQL